MDAHELAERLKDGVGLGAGRDGRHSLHLGHRRGDGADNVYEAGDDFLRKGKITSASEF